MSSAAILSIARKFPFDSAHRLPNVPPEHKCSRMHGHTYILEVEITGPVDPKTGWVMDYGELAAVVRSLVERLDHRVLNEIEGMVNTTAEEIAVWFWDHLKPHLPLLSRVTIYETPMTRCDYFGETVK